jgi:DNA invertase Pin-like site-specific DNA recombinase
MACRPLPEETNVQTLAEVLVESFTDLLVSKGTQHAAAHVIAKRQVDQVLQRMGGGWFYLPKRMDYSREAQRARNSLAIGMLKQGIPAETVIATLKISRRTLYRLQGKKS